MTDTPESSTLSTHVLDTMHGCPAVGVAVTLTDSSGIVLWSGTTDGDGRCVGLPPVVPGRYTITFQTAAYFRAKGVQLPYQPFLDHIPVYFGIIADGHYHVPLLVSPYAYSTYRGS